MTRQNLRFCVSCARLMGDELGDLCDHCGGEMPPPDPPAPTVKPLYRAPMIWSLIALNIAWYFVARNLWSDPWDWFASLGPAVLSGAWWRLATALLTHKDVEHLLDNMFALWLFGRHIERLLGAWTSLALYLACGLTGGVVSLAVHPEQASAGASDAIMGMAGAVLIAYASRYRILTTRQKWKFWIVTVWTLYALTPETPKPGEMNADFAAHWGGFSAGLVLGYLLTKPTGERRQFRLGITACTLAVLILASLTIRLVDAYAVHIEAAERAMNRGDEAAATKELQVALAMRPTSLLAQAIRGRIENLHPVLDDCQTFFSFTGEAERPKELCKDLTCNGELHSLQLPLSGRRLTYVGYVSGPTPCFEDGDIWAQTTSTVQVQEFDAAGKTVCSSNWKSETKDKLKGLPSHAAAAQAGPLRSFHLDDARRGTIGFAECAK